MVKLAWIYLNAIKPAKLNGDSDALILLFNMPTSLCLFNMIFQVVSAHLTVMPHEV